MKRGGGKNIRCGLQILHYTSPVCLFSGIFPTHQQGDLSLSNNIDDILILLGLFIHLSCCSSKSSRGTAACTSQSLSRSPGLGRVLSAHVTPWQGEHQPRGTCRIHTRPCNLGVWVDPRRQQLIWKQSNHVMIIVYIALHNDMSYVPIQKGSIQMRKVHTCIRE